MLVYTTQVNSAFRARWLVNSEVISKVLFTSEQPKRNKMASRVALCTESNVLAVSYSTCVVYTKTIIHLSVGESGGYLPPLWWIIVNYWLITWVVFDWVYEVWVVILDGWKDFLQLVLGKVTFIKQKIMDCQFSCIPQVLLAIGLI